MTHARKVLARSAFAAGLTAAGLAPAEAPGQVRHYDVVERSIPELQAAMAAGLVTSRELVDAYLARIEAYDRNGPRLQAMVALNPRAGDEAAALDEDRRRRGPRGPLHGVPIVLKDNFETADLPTTASSLVLRDFVTGRDAFQVTRLRRAGVVILGKTNLHELAYGITTVSSLGGQTRNPYDPARNPGGSSGGTGAAIAASLAAAGMGSDTCGSIRIPAAHNNLVGLRGTRGLSSRHGLVPLSHSQDIGGPIARTVVDLALMLDATVGEDPSDPVTETGRGRIPSSFAHALRPGATAGLRVGVLDDLFGSAAEDREVGQVVRAALAAMAKHGARVAAADIDDLPRLLQGTSVINAELRFDLLDYLAQHARAPVRSLADLLARAEHHPSVDDLLRRADAVESRDSEAYRAAQARRAALRRTVLEAMDARAVDVLAYPTLRRKAALIGQPQIGSNCQLSAATDLPAISFPAGFTREGVPVGLELLGRPFTETLLLNVAYDQEQLFHRRRPPPGTPAVAAPAGSR